MPNDYEFMSNSIVRMFLIFGAGLLVAGQLLVVFSRGSVPINYTISWTGLVLFGFAMLAVVVEVLMTTPAVADYATQLLPYHVRAFGLLAVLSALIYFAFFFDKSVFSADLVKTLTSQQAKLAVLEHKHDRLQSEQKFLQDELYSQKPVATTAETAALMAKKQKYFQETLVPQIESVEEELELAKGNVKILQQTAAAADQQDHYTNVLFAIRALCLGGIGALVTLLARRTIETGDPDNTFFHAPRYWPLLIKHTILGGLIALVAFALFYTKQITIFKPDNAVVPVGGEPEFWRVTLLCIISGAFADKIYTAVSSQVEKYTTEGGTLK